MDRARLLAGQFQESMTRLETAWVVMVSCMVGPVTGVASEEEVSAFSHETQKILVGRAESWRREIS